MAERMRFELMVGVTLRRFSKPMPSATRPPLRARFIVLFQGVLILWLVMISGLQLIGILTKKLSKRNKSTRSLCQVMKKMHD